MSSDIVFSMTGFWPRKEMLEQLSDLNRVMTVNGPLLLNVMDAEMYMLRRYREAEYDACIIDCFASHDNKTLLRQVFSDWYGSKYGVSTTRMQFDAECVVAAYDRYVMPSSTVLSVFGWRNDPILWFIDIANTTKQWEILEPNRHLAIVGFKGFGFKD